MKSHGSEPVKKFMTKLPQTVGSEKSVEFAFQKMQELKCRHLPVLEGGKLVGIISSRDVDLAKRIDSKMTLKIEELMTDEPVVVDPETSVNEVSRLMTREKINSVIVRASLEEPWGIFTSTDALKLHQ